MCTHYFVASLLSTEKTVVISRLEKISSYSRSPSWRMLQHLHHTSFPALSSYFPYVRNEGAIQWQHNMKKHSSTTFVYMHIHASISQKRHYLEWKLIRKLKRVSFTRLSHTHRYSRVHNSQMEKRLVACRPKNPVLFFHLPSTPLPLKQFICKILLSSKDTRELDLSLPSITTWYLLHCTFY